MSDRDSRLYLEDILEAISAIESYVTDLDFENFTEDRKTYSATLREFIVIGEAIQHIPQSVRNKASSIDWRLIKDFRNFIVHEYFGIDPRIVWDAVNLEVPILKKEIEKLLSSL